jgi:hypothetical protein
MNQALVQALREIRKEIAHGQRRFDGEFLGKRLKELQLSVPPADLQWFVAELLRGFGSTGEYSVPPGPS